MEIQELDAEARASSVALWHRVGITRPWNVPEDDFDRALNGPSSVILGVIEGGVVVGTAMVGCDGHRGWVYYLAVDPSQRHTGLGSALMDEAEKWVRSAGIARIQLMVRADNADAESFYRHRGYEVAGVKVFSRDLS